MFAGLPSLSHEQQQKAVERIQELMLQRTSSGQVIVLVAEKLRASYTGERIVACLEGEDEQHSLNYSDCLNFNFVFRVH